MNDELLAPAACEARHEIIVISATIWLKFLQAN